MNNWRDKLYRFMQGRYGRIDELGRFLMYLLFGLLLVSFFVRSSIFSLLILLVLIYDYYRILSKDISARYQENQHYIQAREKVRTKWNKLTGKSRRQHPSNLQMSDLRTKSPGTKRKRKNIDSLSKLQL